MNQLSATIDDYLDWSDVTSGSFETEDEAKIAFHSAFSATECFTIYEEVDCWYFGGSIFGDRPTGRIDYLLTPRKRLLESGWKMGVIGVEVKKSGHKAGPLLCQMLDYSKAVFRLPDACGASLVCLSAICCFPGISGKGRATESIMANHRIGVARVGKWDTNILVNSTNIFSHSSRGIECRSISSGYKNGSR